MKRILFFIFFFHMLCAQSFGYEKLIDTKWDNLLKKEFKSSSTINKFPKNFIGKTVYFKGRGSYISSENGYGYQCFLNVVQDTIWINKPKKNPKLYKDYTLMPYYHGIGEKKDDSFIDDRYTPISEIEGVPFRIESVSEKMSETYGIYNYCYIYLLNLNTQESLIWVSSDRSDKDITFYSDEIAEEMIPFHTKLYKNTGSSYSAKASEFEEYTIDNATYECEVTNLYYSPKLMIKLSDNNGRSHSYTYDNEDYKYSYSIPKYITLNDYNKILDEEKSYELDPVTDIKSIKYPFPFSFRQIWGETKSSGYVYQKIAGKNSYSDIKGYLDAESTVRIAGKQTIKGTEYYVATCCGKCFYIPTNNVSLEDAEKLKLDSLMSCSQEVKENFLEVTKGFELYQYVQDTKELLKEFDSFKKYGLSIVEWKVYDESEYTDGTGIRFCFYNPTNSMIKYITITFTGYNAVDDPVGRAVTRKCVGPIDPDTSAEYQFEYAWFTDIVEYAKIRSIKVDYKNGTSKTITNIGAIEWSDDLYDYFQNPPLKDLTTLKTKGEPTE